MTREGDNDTRYFKTQKRDKEMLVVCYCLCSTPAVEGCAGGEGL